MVPTKSSNQNWHQLAKYGEHVMTCPVCRPIEGKYCELANELSVAVYGDREEHQIVVRQRNLSDKASVQHRRCRGELVV